MSTIVDRPLNWNGIAAITNRETGETIGWTKRKAGHAGRSAYDCYLNTHGTFRDAEYVGTTTTGPAAEKKVRWHWGQEVAA